MKVITPKKGRIAKRLIALVTVLSMVVVSAPLSTKADEEPAEIQDTYLVDGVTYYNTGSTAFNDDSDKFLKDVIGNRSDVLPWQYEGSDYVYTRSMADLWLETAAGILRGRDYVNTDGRFTVLIDKSASQASPIYSHSEYGEANKYTVDKMMSDDMETPKKAEAYLYQTAGFSSAQGTTGYFKNDTSKNTTLVTAVKARVGSDYRTAAVFFNNFKVVPIFPADAGKNFVTTTVDDSTNYSKVVASNVKNNTAQTVQGTQSLAKSYSASVSSTISGSETYSYEESIKVGAEFKFGFFEKLGVEVSFTASQAFEKGWEEQKATEESDESTQEISVELPPYTNVMMQQKTSTAEYITKYNCPIGVTFDATVVIYDKNGIFKVDSTPCVFEYKNNARKTLAKRYKEYKNADRKDSDGINWTRVKDYDSYGTIKTHIVEALGKVTTYVPDSPAGAQLNQKMDVVSGEVTGIMPIYPLRKIKTTQKSLGMIVGDSESTDQFELEGYNEQNAPYYGFNANKGYWRVVDKDGNPISREDAPVELVTDPVSGEETVEAVKPGTCYLKYIINEYVYNTASNPSHYTSNYELDSTAVIKVDVDDGKSIEVKGSYEGYVNEAPEAIDADGKLYVAVYDVSGIEVDAEDVTWEKQEKNGITLDGNMVSFTKPGTYHVRARSGNLVSEFVEITAKERPVETTTEEPTTKEETTTVEPTTAEPTTEEVTTEKTVIDAPTGLQFYQTTGNRYVFSWNQVRDADYYVVYLNGEQKLVTTNLMVLFDGSDFVKEGEYIIGVAAVKSHLISEISLTRYYVIAPTETPTAEPTTVEPTTVEPTTEEPTTEEPTTEEQTTAEPTTEAQIDTTTVSPTTSAVQTTKNTTPTTNKVQVTKPGKAKVTKAIKKKSAKKISITLKKVAGAKGYEVAVFKSKKAKKALVKKTTTKLKFTISSKKLKRVKTVYVKARAYVMDGTSKLFGGWGEFKKSSK